MGKITLEVKLSAEDIYQVSEYMRQYNESTSKENQKFVVFSIIAFIVIFVVFSMSPRFTALEALFSSIVIIGGLIAISFIFSVFFRTISKQFYKRWLHKTFAKRELTPASSNITLYEFNEAGIELIEGLTKKSSFWNQLGVIEMPIAYLLVNNSNQVEAIFPKRCFNDASHENAFRNLITKQLRDKAKLELRTTQI